MPLLLIAEWVVPRPCLQVGKEVGQQLVKIAGAGVEEVATRTLHEVAEALEEAAEEAASEHGSAAGAGRVRGQRPPSDGVSSSGNPSRLQ